MNEIVMLSFYRGHFHGSPAIKAGDKTAEELVRDWEDELVGEYFYATGDCSILTAAFSGERGTYSVADIDLFLDGKPVISRDCFEEAREFFVRSVATIEVETPDQLKEKMLAVLKNR